MNLAVKELWLTALRSGKYKQGRLTLKRVSANGTEHCCLGVLCEIAVAVGVVSERSEPAESFGSVVHHYGDGAFGLPPKAVCDWAGLDKETVHGLAYRNDGGASLSNIADHIANNL